MRLPLIWRPHGPPVSSLDRRHARRLVVARRDVRRHRRARASGFTEAARLPVSDGEAAALGHERVITEWDSVLFGIGVHLRTVTRDGWGLHQYAPGTVHDGTRGRALLARRRPAPARQPVGRSGLRAVRDDLVADLRASVPPARTPQLPRRRPRLTRPRLGSARRGFSHTGQAQGTCWVMQWMPPPP